MKLHPCLRYLGTVFPLVVLAFVLFGCCIQLKKRQTLNQESGTFVPNHTAYEGRTEVQLGDSLIINCTSVILFSDGSLVTTPLLNDNDVNKTIQNNSQFEVYKSGSRFQWGKYYIKNDTVFIEHIYNVSSGGGFCKMRSLRYKAYLTERHLEIFAGPEKIYKYGSSSIYPMNGLLLRYAGSISENIIDPSNAKINR